MYSLPGLEVSSQEVCYVGEKSRLSGTKVLQLLFKPVVSKGFSPVLFYLFPPRTPVWVPTDLALRVFRNDSAVS